MLNDRQVCDELTRSGEMTQLGVGSVALSGRPLHLVDFFDRVFEGFALTLGAMPHSLPTLLPLRAADQFEVLESFGHLASLVSSMPAGEEHLNAFLNSRRNKPPTNLSPGALEPPTQMLSTAVCYQLYLALQGKDLAGSFVATARGRCFRREPEAVTSLRRLCEFSMREIVTIAGPATVRSNAAHLRKATQSFARHLGLAPRLVEAVDPFFSAARGKELVQRMKKLKHEFVLPIGDEATTAVASINQHEQFFVNAANIRVKSTRTTASGCVAFGLERWALAFLCRHGLDQATWPSCARTGVCGHAEA